MNKAPSLVLLAAMLLQGCGSEDVAAPTAEAPAANVAQSPAAPAPATAPASASADSKFQDLQGQPLDLSAYAGKKIFLNYWATWCAPCIREIPAITRASAELEDEGYVFLLASDESIDTINEFVLDREFSGNFIKLSKFFGAWNIQAVPSSELYDENGNLVVTWNGAYEWDSPDMLDAIRNGTPVELTTGQ